MAKTPRAQAMENYAKRSIEEDHAAHKDVAGGSSSDRPAQRPSTNFSATPNTTERPTWAPKR